MQTARRLSRFSLVKEKGLEEFQGIPGLTAPLSRDDNDPMSPQSKSQKNSFHSQRFSMLG